MSRSLAPDGESLKLKPGGCSVFLARVRRPCRANPSSPPAFFSRHSTRTGSRHSAMADNTVPQQQYAGPAAPPYSEKVKAQYIQQTPAWVVIVRALQVLFGFIVLCMAGWLIHGYAMGANAFAVVCVSVPRSRQPCCPSRRIPGSDSHGRACSLRLSSAIPSSPRRCTGPTGHTTSGRSCPSTS